MPAHLSPGWSITLSLRISAACRHWSQAVLRGRNWVPQEFVIKRRKKNKTRDAENNDGEEEADDEDKDEESGAEAEEPEDHDAQIVKDWGP
jgi:hypothetical protein